MLQGEYIDTILLRVNGGNLSDEGSVQRDDIRAYLPSAINYATSKAYYTNRTQEGDRDFPSSFYGTYENLAIDKTGKVPTVALPFTVLDLPSNQGIRMVMDDCGNGFTPLSDMELSMVNYYKNIFIGERFYRRDGKSLRLWNISKLAQHINVVMMIDPSNFDDDTEVPVQAGMETDVINQCVQFFTDQRRQPADELVNKNDVNSQP